MLGEEGHASLINSLRSFEKKFDPVKRGVKAILVISAHYEASVPTLTSAQSPSLLYDYYGFPPESYEIKYPCPGAPDVAKRIEALLKEAGISVAFDEKRGLDHGVFIPLKLMVPSARIPCLQISLHKSLDPAYHLKLGQAMARLREEGVLIIGSGMTTHNMQGLMSQDMKRDQNLEFDRWLIESCKTVEKERETRFIQWKTAPGALYNHPREEHLVPLFVCAGAAER